MKTYILMILAAMSLLSCDKTPQEECGGNEEFTPVSLTRTEESINQGANEFGLKVYRSLAADGKSLSISPLSLSLALSLTSYGAREVTLEQMLTTLGFKGFSSDDVGNYYKKMVRALLEADKGTTLEIANSIWADKGISLKKAFRDGAESYYSSEVRSVDFTKDSIVPMINAWCSDKTHGMIRNAADEMDPATIMALVNALYFKGIWQKEFNPAVKGVFTCLDGRTSSQKMMYGDIDGEFSEYGGYRMVSIPYGNGAFVMDLIMPVEDGSKAFRSAVEGLDWKTYSQLVSRARYCSVFVKMPLFKMDFGKDLSKLLSNLGMPDAFTGAADFSGMSDAPMCISQVIHKTAVEVNEKGTEAAAVTIVEMKMTSAFPSPSETFIADRPFIFSIRETSTNSLLFLGQKVE